MGEDYNDDADLYIKKTTDDSNHVLDKQSETGLEKSVKHKIMHHTNFDRSSISRTAFQKTRRKKKLLTTRKLKRQTK